MSDIGFVSLAYGVTWTVLAGYCIWTLSRVAQARRAWAETSREDGFESRRGEA
jgi:hypothetical protein